MNRFEKKTRVEDLAHVFAASSMIIVSRNNGLSAIKMRDFRRSIRKLDGECNYKIVKNTLSKLALKDSHYKEALEELFKGPNTITYCINGDSVAVAKTVVEFCKENTEMEIVAAAVPDKAVSIDELKELASLPPIDVLRAQLLGVLIAPMSNIINVFKANSENLVRIIEAYADKKQGGGV